MQARLFRYIEDRHNSLKDPYLGNPLNEYWLEMLENRDVQEYGDFALTCFYDPAGNWGIGNRWIEIDELLFESHRSALLGFSIGSVGKLFDPGGMGSYFQTPEQVLQSLEVVCNLNIPFIAIFRELLEISSQQGFGIYVTF